MQTEKLTKVIDGLAEGNEVKDLLSSIISEKTRDILEITEKDESIHIKNNDVFLGKQKVGSFTVEGDDIEFVDSEGNSKTFNNDDEMMEYVAGLNESDTAKIAVQRKEERLKQVQNRPHDTDSPMGEYKKTKLASDHKDPRMENPSNHEHGKDDPSGTKLSDTSSGGSQKSTDGPTGDYDKHELSSKHKDDRMENPKKNDHGLDDSSADDEITAGGKEGSAPDKEYDVRKKHKKNDHQV